MRLFFQVQNNAQAKYNDAPSACMQVPPHEASPSDKGITCFVLVGEYIYVRCATLLSKTVALLTAKETTAYPLPSIQPLTA